VLLLLLYYRGEIYMVYIYIYIYILFVFTHREDNKFARLTRPLCVQSNWWKVFSSVWMTKFHENTLVSRVCRWYKLYYFLLFFCLVLRWKLNNKLQFYDFLFNYINNTYRIDGVSECADYTMAPLNIKINILLILKLHSLYSQNNPSCLIFFFTQTCIR